MFNRSNKKKTAFLCIQLLVLALICANYDFSSSQMAFIMVVQAFCYVFLLHQMSDIPYISVSNLFLLLTVLFHGGQLIKEALHIAGSVPLPYQSYANSVILQKSFCFILLSQAFFFSGNVIYGMMRDSGHISFQFWEKKEKIGNAEYAKFFILLGMIPRIYIDTSSLIGAMRDGYRGVYTLYFPQPIQTLAFFFDVGLFFLLIEWKKTRQCFLFVAVIVYKCLMMLCGSRAERVIFLLIWFFLYFFVLKKKSWIRTIVLFFLGIASLFFLNAITMLRNGEGMPQIGQIVHYISSVSNNRVIGGVLGEFGAALDTLEVAICFTPATISYGYGRSYVAGLLSVIPLLVRHIPFLSGTTVFLSFLPKRILHSLGGSYLAECYYNFSRFGSAAVGLIGFAASYIDSVLNQKNNQTVHKTWGAVCAFGLLLMVRGYFTDIVQKMVWTFLAILLVSYIYSGKKKECGDEE